MDQPFLDSPNVVTSPHNSAQGTGAHDISLCRAVENCRRALAGGTPLHIIGSDEWMIRINSRGMAVDGGRQMTYRATRHFRLGNWISSNSPLAIVR